MSLIHRNYLLLTCFLVPLCGQAGPDLSNSDMKRYRVAGDFAEVEAFLTDAISEQGIKINNVAHIGEMLLRTGQDIGKDKPIFKFAKAMEFCSATLSREMFESDPHNIIFCPYIIY